MRDNGIDISCKPSPHHISNRVGRLVWSAVWVLLFRPSFKTCHGWRRFLLRLFGARISSKARIHASAKVWAPWNLTMEDYATLGPSVDCGCAAPIFIGANSTVSQYTYLCAATHDYEHPNMLLITKSIHIEDQVWICAGVYVGPGLTIKQGSVVGARAVVVKDVEPWTVVAGNPAGFIKKRELKNN